VVIVLGIAWIATGSDFFLAKVFSPKMEQVRQDTFKNSQAYNEGMAKDIESIESDYIQATDPQVKAGLKGVIKQKLAGYDTTKFSPDLQKFLKSLDGVN
jgi:hypothetical protein